MKILIDNGHGIDTNGKRSPDDYRFLLSKEGRQAIVDLHVVGILDYLANCVA